MSDPDALPPQSKPPTPSENGFRAPEALISGLVLGFVGLGIVLLVLRGANIEWTWAYWGEHTTGENGGSTATFDRSVIFRNFGLLILALIALPLAIWRSWTAHLQTRTANEQSQIANRQADLAKKGQIINRFQQGAQMLESTELSVRLAGIYALRELAKSDPKDTYIMVLDLLFDFVREKSQKRGRIYDPVPFRKQGLFDRSAPTFDEVKFEPIPQDIQKALEAASWLRNQIDDSKLLEKHSAWRPDLRSSNLAGTHLSNANLSNAQLEGADLREADLRKSDLSKANFYRAKMSRSYLSNADLSFAELAFADLSRAQLGDSYLIGANLYRADLSAADLHRTNLKGAGLHYASFISARLHKTIMIGTQLQGADMTDALLYDADLTNAVLIEANLTITRFDQAVLDGATVKRIWAFKNYSQFSLPGLIERSSVFRDRNENWDEFAERAGLEHPELGW